MSAIPPPPADENAPFNWARPMFVEHIDMLGRLAQIGIKAAETVERQMDVLAQDDAPAEAVETAQRALTTLPRVARAVRQSVMLRERLIKDLVDWDRRRLGYAADNDDDGDYDDEDNDDADDAAGEPSDPHAAIADRIGNEVERAALRNDRDDETAEGLARLARERLERLDYGEVLDRPFDEVVAQICRDLDLEPGWPALAAAEHDAAAEAADGPFDDDDAVTERDAPSGERLRRSSA